MPWNLDMKMKITTLIMAAAMSFFAFQTADAQSQSFKLGQWTEIHNSIIKELNRSYVDTLPIDRIMRVAVDAMLEELDPYTTYIPEEENEDLRGRLAEKENPEPTVIYQTDPEQEKKLDKAEEEKQVLKSELADKDKALEKAKALNEAMVEDLKDLRKRLEEVKMENAEPAKVEIKGDAIVVFKVKFETFQDLLEDMFELIGKMNKDEAAKCRAAFHAVIEDCGI